MANEDPPKTKTRGDSAPHRGQDNDGHLDQKLLPNLEAPGPGNQEGQQPEEPANDHAMRGGVPPKIIERQECKHLLERIGFRVDTAQTIV